MIFFAINSGGTINTTVYVVITNPLKQFINIYIEHGGTGSVDEAVFFDDLKSKFALPKPRIVHNI